MQAFRFRKPNVKTIAVEVWLTAVLFSMAGNSYPQDTLQSFSQDGSQHALFEAVKLQDIVLVEKLLAEGVDVNSKQGDGSSPLHWAIYRNDQSISDLLLNNAADANVSNDLGVTPLALAILNSNSLLVRRLLEAGADANKAKTTGETPLMVAARVGDAEVIKLLLNHGASVQAVENSKAQTALMFAVAGNHLEAASLLIDQGASPTARTKGQFTPLLFAAQQGNLELAKLLLAKGADVNETAPDGIAGDTNARAYFKPDTEASALLVAIDSGHATMAHFLLKYGADPSMNGAGRTALHSAVQHRMPDVVKALLNYGANPNARLTSPMPVLSRVIFIDNGMAINELGATPFFLAASYGDVEIMETLVAGGADPMLTSDDGTTALMVAAGVDFVEGQDKYKRRWFADNNRALEVAAIAAVKKCLEYGNTIDATNDKNQTALHGAVYLGGTELVTLLLEKGANINAINNRGQTPWMIAGVGEYRAGSFYKKEVVASYLESLGADLTLGEDRGRYFERDLQAK